MKFFIKTFGCKVNQYESQVMREVLENAGFSETDDIASSDYLILNSCAVTGESERKSLYYIRNCKRKNPALKVVLTGCMAPLSREMGETVDFEISNIEKKNIAALLTGKRFLNDEKISYFKGHSRAFIKIEDGCDMRCSYCKIRIVRNKVSSKPVEDVLDEAERLVKAGYCEIVLTGILIGAYGKDLYGRKYLSNLIDLLSGIDGLRRIRISSIEPFSVNKPLISVMAKRENVMPHLHIPLQSGSNKILRLMRRGYTAERFKEIITELRRRVDGFSYTTDVIAGFPGEDDKDFCETLSVLYETEPFKIHVFPFSAREGTEAFEFFPRVPVREVKGRKEKLFKVNKELFKKNSEKLIGKKVEVYTEKFFGGKLFGLLKDYRQASIAEGKGLKNSFINAEVYGLDIENETLLLK